MPSLNSKGEDGLDENVLEMLASRRSKRKRKEASLGVPVPGSSISMIRGVYAA